MLNFLHRKKIVDPELKDVEEVIEECQEVADKYKIEPLGDLGCPVPPEVE